ncbi:hypothetical protein BDW42DRAFT_171404 [Aspergillus taichungensis]|uniref:Uncharacterized protein n=1 Tax=Aspergillus taichungensis TaxID=482145 RepID=A0A2J5HSB1_9EURO|nr:hypothetical protein BDW42DRAFT_171404 [Aspergillus taichungensis]
MKQKATRIISSRVPSRLGISTMSSKSTRTQAFQAFNAALAGLLAQETTAHSHNTSHQTTAIFGWLWGWRLLVLHRLGRRRGVSSRGRVVLPRGRLLVGHDDRGKEMNERTTVTEPAVCGGSIVRYKDKEKTGISGVIRTVNQVRQHKSWSNFSPADRLVALGLQLTPRVHLGRRLLD